MERKSLDHCFSNAKKFLRNGHHFEKPHGDQLERSALRWGGGGGEEKGHSVTLEVMAYMERNSNLVLYRLIFLIFLSRIELQLWFTLLIECKLN